MDDVKNKMYWAKRYEASLDDSMKKARLTNGELKANYQKAIRRLEKNMNDWYRRFAHENSISLQEARKILSNYELKQFRLDLKGFIKEAKSEDLSESHIKMLEQASIRERLSREQALYISVVHEVERLATSQNIKMNSLLSDVYESAAYKAAYLAQSQRGEYSIVNRVNPDAVDRVINAEWASDGKDFSSRIWTDKVKLIKALQNDFTQSFIVGEGMDDMSQKLANRLNVSYNNARRLVETETARVHEQASLDSMERLDVDKLEILATLDRKTSKICRRMDGKVVPIKDARPGVTVPPFHCYCRSTTIPYIEGLKGESRTARGKDGKSMSIDKMTYDEWADKYLE